MSSGFRLRDFFQVVFRHKGKMATFFTAVMAATWAALVLWPREYESEVKLMVRVGRESVALDPTATTGQTLMLQKSQEDEINSALDVLSSRHLAELVVDRLGPEYILDGPQDTDQGNETASPAAQFLRESMARAARAADWCLSKSGVRDGISDRELAVRRLRKNLSIYAPKQSTVITINYRAQSPVAARKTAAEVTDAYLSEHVRVSRTQGSREFFEEQSTMLADRLQQKTAQVGEFRKEHGIVSIAANEELLKEQLSGVQSDLRSAMVSLGRANAEAAELKAKLAVVEPELVASKAGSADPTWSAMRQLVFQLEIEEKELAGRYTDAHPQLRNLRSQIKAVKEQFDENQADRTDATVTPNPLAQSLTQQLVTAEAQAEGIRTSIASLQSQRADLFAKLEGLIDQEARLEKMERELAVLESNYHSHQGKLEEARIIDALQKERISNVNVVQPATFVEKPTSPKKRVIAALALFFAVSGAISLAFFAEMLDPTLRTTEQAESQLDMPVLSTIPAGLRRRDLRKCLAEGDRRDVLDVHCKSLLQQILSARTPGDDSSTSLGVLSVSPGNGGSTLAAQLAIVAGRDLGLSTLLIDTDNEQKFVTTAFHLNGAPGLSELLANEATEADCIQRVAEPNFSVISSASQDRLGALKLDPRNVGARLESLKRQYDLVIVDLPPATTAGDGVSLSGLLDHVLLVVESEKTVGISARRVRAQLLRSHAKLSGAVLTKTREYVPRWLNGAG